jgi:hypothetical protein
MDRPEQDLLLLVDWVVAARLVEDAARGRRPAACMLLVHALTHLTHASQTAAI